MPVLHTQEGQPANPAAIKTDFRATRRDEGVHWDFLRMGSSCGANMYVLAVKDALAPHCELFPSAASTDEARFG